MSKFIKVTAALMSRQGRVLIAQRGVGHHLAGKWEFPGGKIEPGETPAECLKRELREEFEIDVRVGEFLGSSLYHYEHMSIELLLFRVEWKGGTLRNVDHAKVEWVPCSQLAAYDFAPADQPFVNRVMQGEFTL